MRSLLFCLLVTGCATTPGSEPEPFSPQLAKYEHVFHGSPDNGSLPDMGKADGTYPAKSTELIAFQSPVKDQDRRGVCTIFTTTALMEHLYIKAGMMKPSFSEQYLQWSVKDQLGVLPESEGSNISDNVEAIAQFGIPDEAADPYYPKQWTEANDPDCKITGEEGQTLPGKCWTQGDPPDSAKMAKMYYLPRGKFLNTKSIKEHITTAHTAVGVGIDFFYQAWNHGASTLPINRDEMTKGIVRYPNQSDITESHKQRAGHGILIVGWDADYTAQKVDKDDKPMVDAQGKPILEKGFYIFKNSWGTDIFGVTNPNGAGYGYISQKYIEDYGTAYITDIPALDQGPAMP
jgi:C1A family cysteine protease